MKKLIFALAALLLFTLCAAAEGELFAITEAGSTLTGDFDLDGIQETMTFTCSLNEYDDGGFTIAVNGKGFTFDDCMSLEPVVYTAPWTYGGTMFFVNEYGPSDDPLTYCFYYNMEELRYAGMVPALVRYFDVDNSGIIHTDVRARMIGTWSRPADFMLAFGASWDENAEDFGFTFSYKMCEVPRDLYPMGMIVTLKRSLPLLASRFDTVPALTLSQDQQVILTATDDVSWLYVFSPEEEAGGWVRIAKEDWTDCVIINGMAENADDVFSGIFYAD